MGFLCVCMRNSRVATHERLAREESDGKAKKKKTEAEGETGELCSRKEGERKETARRATMQPRCGLAVSKRRNKGLLSQECKKLIVCSLLVLSLTVCLNRVCTLPHCFVRTARRCAVSTKERKNSI